MGAWLETLLILLVLTNLRLLGSSRLGSCIRTVAIQGVLLGALPILAHADDITPRLLLLSTVGVGLKGATFPWLLFRALRGAKIRREIEPFVGYTASLLFGVAALAASLWLSSHLPLTERGASSLLVA